MKQRIAVAGAGPVGLTAALCLARAGHEVRLFEKREALSTASRASTFHAPTLDMLATLGVLDEVAPLGRRIDAIDYYRCNTGHPELAARFAFSLLAGHTAYPWRMHLEQGLLTPVLKRALDAEPGVRIEFNAAIEGMEEGERCIEVEVRRGTGVLRETFDWLIAADGAHSAVRAAAKIDFEGSDDTKRVLRIMSGVDLRRLIPGLAGIAYLYNDSDSISLLEMSKVWRIIVRLAPEISDETALSAAFIEHELQRFLPLGKLADAATDIYATSQRIAAGYRRGRVLLAGDAAHVTNTRGGMNMNCGLHDAWTLGQVFAARDVATLDAALDAWAAARSAIVVDELVPRTERMVGGGATFLAAVEATARTQDRALQFVRDAAMLDIAPAFTAAAAAPRAA